MNNSDDITVLFLLQVSIEVREIVSCVDFKQMFECEDITHDYFLDEWHEQILSFDLQADNLVLELDLANELLRIEFKGSYLIVHELSSRVFALFQHLKFDFWTHHEQHAIVVLTGELYLFLSIDQ